MPYFSRLTDSKVKKLPFLSCFILFIICFVTTGSKTGSQGQRNRTNSNADTASVILVRTSGADKIQAVGAIAQLNFEPLGCRVYNGSISQFLQGLKASYLKDARLTLIDGTAYTGHIDLLLDTPLNTIDDLNKALASYDLRFIPKELPGDKPTSTKEN